MTAEEYIKKATSAEGLLEELARKLAEVKMPEFSSEEMTVADTSALTGIPEQSVRMGIVYGWFPVGVATRGGKRVTEYRQGDRSKFTIYPRKVWEVTGHIWRGRAALKGETP